MDLEAKRRIAILEGFAPAVPPARADILMETPPPGCYDARGGAHRA